jgi:hypothetical protein
MITSPSCSGICLALTAALQTKVIDADNGPGG